MGKEFALGGGDENVLDTIEVMVVEHFECTQCHYHVSCEAVAFM